MELSKELRNSSKGLVNMKNEDDECFRWCHIRHLLRWQGHAGVKKTDRLYREKLNYDGIQFPVTVKQYNCREKQNSIRVWTSLGMRTSNPFHARCVSRRSTKVVWTYCCYQSVWKSNLVEEHIRGDPIRTTRRLLPGGTTTTPIATTLKRSTRATTNQGFQQLHVFHQSKHEHRKHLRWFPAQQYGESCGLHAGPTLIVFIDSSCLWSQAWTSSLTTDWRRQARI